MPTGVEEFFGGVVTSISSAVQGAAFTSAISGPLDPNGAIEALQGAFSAPQSLPPVQDFEGSQDAGAVIVLASAADGTPRTQAAPADGDRPPPAQGFAPPMDEIDLLIEWGVPETIIDEELVFEAPDADEDSASSDNGGEDPNLQTATTDSHEADPVAPANPPAGSGDGTDSWIPADLADRWEKNVTWTPTAWFWDMSGEQASDAAKKAIDDVLTDFVDDISPENEALRAVVSALAAGAKVPTELAVDTVTGVLDPGSQVRGLLRTGTATPQGLRDVEQGKVAVGVSKIVGEASGVVLTVVSPVKTVRTRRTAKHGGTFEVVEKFGVESQDKVQFRSTGHNIVRVTEADKTVRSTQVLDAGNGTAAAMRAIFKESEIKENGGSLASVRVPPELIEKISSRIMRAEAKGNLGKLSYNPLNVRAENCAKYAASLARAGGIVAVGSFGPKALVWQLKMSIPGFLPVGGAFGVVVQGQQANRSYPNRPR